MRSLIVISRGKDGIWYAITIQINAVQPFFQVNMGVCL